MKDNVFVAYIHGGVLEHEFSRCLFETLGFDSNRNRWFQQKIGHIKGPYLDDNRNEIGREFMARDEGHLLFLDTDHKFPPELIYALVQTAKEKDLPILSALYFSELHEGQINAVWFEEQPEGGLRTISHFQTNQIVPLAAVGMGCCLIRRDVMEAFLKVPEWANDSWTWFGRDQYKYKGRTYHYGEDMCFCVRAKSLGFQTYGHSGLILGHIKKWNLDLDMVQMLVNYKKELGHVSQPYKVNK